MPFIKWRWNFATTKVSDNGMVDRISHELEEKCLIPDIPTFSG